LPTWTQAQLFDYVRAASFEAKDTLKRKPTIILLEGYAVDVTDYCLEHPGGAGVMTSRSVKAFDQDEGERAESGIAVDATKDFELFNNHQWASRMKMRDLRIAKIVV